MRSRVISGVAWLGLVRILVRGLAVLKNVVLAGVLTPGDIGTMAVALICLQTLESLTKLGLDNALLSKSSRMKEYVRAAWTINIFRGTVLSTILLFSASWLAAVFGNPQSAPLVRGIALISMLRGFVNPALAELRYELEFNKVAIYDMVVGTGLNLGTIVLVIAIRSVWAIALGLLLSEVLGVLFSYLLVPWRPRVESDVQRLKEVLGYGYWITLTAIVLFIASQFDSVVVARVVGSVELGYYRTADLFSRAILFDLSALVAALTTPIYARSQSDLGTRQRVFLGAISTLAAIIFPVVALVLALGDQFVSIVLGNQWLPSIPLLKLLSIVGAIMVLQTTGGPIFYAMGVPRADFRMNLIRALSLVLLGIPLTLVWGTRGAAFAALVSVVVMLPIWFSLVREFTRVSFSSVLRVLAMPSVASLLVFLAATGLAQWLQTDGWLELVVISGGLIGLYGMFFVGLARLTKSGPLAWAFS